jgi:hypothetical protein
MIRMTQADPEIQRREHFRTQAGWCDKLGSPFTALICRTLADRLDATSGFGHRVLTWPLQTLRGDLVALRCCGALHYHVRSHPKSELALVYPPNPQPDADALWHAVRATIAAHDEELTKFLDTPPQTNEVSRAGVLLGGLLLIAAQWRLPLSLIEIGASAGLNLNFDRFHYDLGERRFWGDPQSDVRIKSEWRGAAPPLEAPLQIAARLGNDQNPLSAARDDDRRRLIAYLWPDQTDRLKRLEAALDIAARHPAEIVEDDAGKFLASCLARKAHDGVARVVFHTIVLQYASQETRASIKQTLAAAGARATEKAPLARFSMEHEKPDEPATVRLTLWPGGEERVIGTCDSHGGWVEWREIGREARAPGSRLHDKEGTESDRDA